MLPFKEIFNLINQRRKFWLYPIVLALILIGSLLLFLQGSPIAPFVYTLF